jgi:hypothetical protein
MVTFVYVWAAAVTVLSIYLERARLQARRDVRDEQLKLVAAIVSRDQQEFWADEYRARCRDTVCPVCDTKLEVK